MLDISRFQPVAALLVPSVHFLPLSSVLPYSLTSLLPPFRGVDNILSPPTIQKDLVRTIFDISSGLAAGYTVIWSSFGTVNF